MTSAITDFNQFSGMRLRAENNDPAVLREVAGQFEALFIQSMLKNMREASLGDPLFGDSDQHAMYEEMLDQQMSVEMASGKGIGLAEMLVRQMGGEPAADQSDRGERSFPLSTEGPRLHSGPKDMDLQDRSDKAFPLSRGGLRLNSEPQYMDLAGRGDTALATTPQASVSKAQPHWTDPKSFAEDIWPHVKRIANKLNVAPEGILAQVALETGWGAHVPTRADGNSSNNLFGIKAGSNWSGDSVAKPTLEFEGGVPRQEVAKFRAYDNLADTFDDYSNLLADNPRYAAVASNGEDVDGFANALQASGYATDPNYADKIRNVLQGKTMQTFLGGL